MGMTAKRDKGVRAHLCLAGSCTQRDHRVHGRICFTSFAVKEPGRNIGVHGRHCFAKRWFQRDIRVHGRICFTWFAARVSERRFTRFDEKRLGETKACVHAFISLGGCLSETFASMDAFVSPSLQGDRLSDRAAGCLPGAGVVWQVHPCPRLHQTRNGAWCSRYVGCFVTQSR